mmetsp:Transcript_47253/g.153362  ORF Transcript_47253/g.153362 Transcript_47253/m.153362 type:complete len:210 (+) Transcript_47253:196-825(+)
MRGIGLAVVDAQRRVPAAQQPAGPGSAARVSPRPPPAAPACTGGAPNWHCGPTPLGALPLPRANDAEVRPVIASCSPVASDRLYRQPRFALSVCTLGNASPCARRRAAIASAPVPRKASSAPPLRRRPSRWGGGGGAGRAAARWRRRRRGARRSAARRCRRRTSCFPPIACGCRRACPCTPTGRERSSWPTRRTPPPTRRRQRGRTQSR